MDPNIPVLNLDPDPGPRDLKTSFVCSKSEAILEKMLIFIKGEGSGEFLSNIIIVHRLINEPKLIAIFVLKLFWANQILEEKEILRATHNKAKRKQVPNGRRNQ